MKEKIKFFVMDVDGTLTDGKIYMGNSGEVFKAFDVKDGYGIKHLLPEYDIIPIVITARDSQILQKRCNELGVIELYQNIHKKRMKLEEIIQSYSSLNNYQYSFENVAYVGDDILDIECMEAVKDAGGIVGCPNDAVKSVKQLADFISSKQGGDGAVREFIEWVIYFGKTR